MIQQGISTFDFAVYSSFFWADVQDRVQFEGFEGFKTDINVLKLRPFQARGHDNLAGMVWPRRGFLSIF